MCGILAISAHSSVEKWLLEGLARLEYRGYDSAGLAVTGSSGMSLRRAKGKLEKLRERIKSDPPEPGRCGIAHTRWATHGRPSEDNAHPHQVDGVAIVHNGIIENFRELRKELLLEGLTLQSDTDSEIIAHLIARYMRKGETPHNAVRNTSQHLQGNYALVAMFEKDPGLLIAICEGSPMVAGIEGEDVFLGSDVGAISPFARNIIHMETGDRLFARTGEINIENRNGQNVNRPFTTYDNSMEHETSKGKYQNFMEKEIHEQPSTLANTINLLAEAQTLKIRSNPKAEAAFADADRAVAIGCGTAYYAACVAKYWFEELAHLGLDVDIASEFRYRSPCLPKRGPALFVSQSGETADTLAALSFCLNNAMSTIGIVNVPESSLSRQTSIHFPTHAGREIGVASTKAFTAQLAALACSAISAGRARKTIGPNTEAQLIKDLLAVPGLVRKALGMETELQQVAASISKVRSILYLGRGPMYPIALEGALKLKELSYIQAEGYAAGELKHGPMALIEENIPVIAVAPFDDLLFAKTLSNMEEVAARGARIVLITDEKGAEQAHGTADKIIEMPTAPRFVQPIVAAIPIQFLALHTALHLHKDVDKPRNLAKSVTVE